MHTIELLTGLANALRKALPYLPADNEAHYCGEWLDEANAEIQRLRDDEPARRMTVRTILGAEAAYACIKTPTRSLDVRLAPGRSVSSALDEAADEIEEKAFSDLRRAQIIRRAAKEARQ